MTAPSALGFSLYNSFPTTASTSWFQTLGSLAAGNATSASGVTPETNFQSRIAFAGTIANATANVIANSRTTATLVTLWQNGSASSLSISISSGATGLITDTSHTVTVAVDDTISCEYAQGTGANALFFGSYVAQFTPSGGGTQQKWGSGLATDNTPTSAFSTFLFINGGAANNGTEANIQTQASVAGTVSNLSINILTNSRSTNGTMRFRKNGANGNGVVTITAATTGIFKDTSNTDTIAATDLLSYSLATGTGATSFVWNSQSAWLTPTTDGEQLISTSIIGTFAVPRFTAIAGAGATNATETNEQSCLGFAGVASLLYVKLTSNSGTNGITITFDVNAAAGNQVITLTAGQTGVFTDTTHTDTLSATDKINLNWTNVNGSTIPRTAGFKFAANTSGNVYNVSISESGSAADTVSNNAILPSAVSDGLTGADTVASAAILPSSVGDGLSAADTVSSTAILPSTIAEVATASDSPSTPGGNSTITDALSAIDQYSSTVNVNSAVSDGLTATNTQSAAGLVASVTVAESVAAVSTQGASLIAASAVGETVSAFDAYLATAIYNSNVADALTATDIYTASAGVIKPGKCDSLDVPFIVRSLQIPAIVRSLGVGCA